MKPLLRAGALVLVLVLATVAALLLPLPDTATVRAWIDAAGPVAPVAFGLGYAALVLLPVPKSVASAAAGLAFGVPLGVLVVLVGAVLGAGAAFWIGRVLGRDAVNRYSRGHLARLDAFVLRHGVLAALGIRVVPVLPFTMLNYACGVTAMRAGHYLLGTCIGLLPGTVLLVALGSRVPPAALIAGSATMASISLLTVVIRYRRSGPQRVLTAADGPAGSPRDTVNG